MLHLNTLSWGYYRSAKTGYNVDYILRNFALKTISNCLIFGSIFLLEKYFIEYLARYVHNSYPAAASVGNLQLSQNKITFVTQTLLLVINLSLLSVYWLI